MVESVGRKLQQARLAQKLEIEEVAERTKIRPDRIIDLEADEYAHFPNLTYAKSFLAKYARFLGLDIQEELDKFQISHAISMGDYQYLKSIPAPDHAQELRKPRRIAPKGFRVPPIVVGVLVLIVLVGVPVLSYLALNIPRVAGPNIVSGTRNSDQAGPESTGATARAVSDAESLKSLARTSPSEESAASPSPAASQQENVKLEVTPTPAETQARIEDGVEVRRALPVGTPPSATQAEKKLEVRVLKRTYVKVTKDEADTQPVFDGFAGPDSLPIVVEGKRFWVHVQDKGAVEVRKDGQLVLGNSDDIVIN
jgi:cytoskeletal protein RodZ